MFLGGLRVGLPNANTKKDIGGPVSWNLTGNTSDLYAISCAVENVRVEWDDGFVMGYPLVI